LPRATRVEAIESTSAPPFYSQKEALRIIDKMDSQTAESGFSPPSSPGPGLSARARLPFKVIPPIRSVRLSGSRTNSGGAFLTITGADSVSGDSGLIDWYYTPDPLDQVSGDFNIWMPGAARGASYVGQLRCRVEWKSFPAYILCNMFGDEGGTRLSRSDVTVGQHNMVIPFVFRNVASDEVMAEFVPHGLTRWTVFDVRISAVQLVR
jgi:hypothetical protein